jgi:hypothetical protein
MTMERDAHAGEREHPLDGKEPWRDRYARVGAFGKTLKRGQALGAKAEPGVGTKLDHVFVELHFASMADAEAYFAGLASQ